LRVRSEGDVVTPRQLQEARRGGGSRDIEAREGQGRDVRGDM